ncbi:MAG TPA: hypothetical protein VHR16_06390 [Candidatus Limnocylindrales bacterium]|nr:hypothetical protein [Candidatus Limnocylindrales bacterium]
MTEPRDDVRCERTRGLIDRVVAERVSAADREHAETCASCGPVLLRSVRFDDELRRSAEGLVVERLPYGVLDPELAPRVVPGMPSVRRAAPGLASVFAALAIVVVAMTMAFAPGNRGAGTQPPATPELAGPPFRPTADVIRTLQALDYSCIPGHSLPTTGPSAGPGEREGVICLTPREIESANASIIPVENGDGDVVQVTIKGSLFGTDTLTSRAELATVMGKLTSESIADPTQAADAGAFIERVLPDLKILPTGDDAQKIFGDVRAHLLRYPGGSYILMLEQTDTH